MKKIIGIIIGLGIAVIAFGSGVRYGVKETGKIYCEGLSASIGTLDIGEQSTEYTLYGEEFGEYNGIKYVITRTK